MKTTRTDATAIATAEVAVLATVVVQDDDAHLDALDAEWREVRSAWQARVAS